MATTAQSVLKAPSSLAWFWQFLEEELRPYPGRAELVARMVAASTIVMLLSMTFRLPYAAYGSAFALSLSRENPRATVSAAKVVVVGFACSVLYVIIGAMLFLGYPDLRLFWVIGTLFVMFFALSALSNYTAAARFGYLLIVTIPLWDEHIPARLRLENTLWAFATIASASVITAIVEVVYARLKPRAELVESTGHRLEACEQVLREYLAGGGVREETRKEITQLTIVGISRLRRELQRSSHSPQYVEQMGAVVVQVGRLVDLTANLTQLSPTVSDDDRKCLRNLEENIARVRERLLDTKISQAENIEPHASATLPLLQEMEKTVSLIDGIFTGTESVNSFAPPLPAETEPPQTLFVRDAFSNPEHIKFALRGCLAASLCYIIYNGKDWPGISTSITTCFLTALSTVGSSRQKQVLRFAGAAVGALLALGAQVFILPGLDSIAGFTILFVALSVLAAWICTSSSRLSYFGLQIAVAIYLINLQDFAVQTSLYPARDRVIGIFLGLLMMWLAFDPFGAVSALTAMKKAFIDVLHSMAQLTREPVSGDLAVATDRGLSLREKINQSFENVRNLGGGVLLEFGASREQDLAMRQCIIEWQPQLRVLFLTRTALWKYRARLPGFELPETVRTAQKQFDEELAKRLDAMADAIGGTTLAPAPALDDFLQTLENAIRATGAAGTTEKPTVQLQTFLSLCRASRDLTHSLEEEMRKAQMSPAPLSTARATA